jgi:cytochrome b subunit of formate dehydrogenase
MAVAIPRLSVHQRVQHGLLALAVCGALASGLLSGAGGPSARSLHLVAGYGALALVVYHFLSLTVQAYVESGRWADLPVLPAAGDGAALVAELRHLFGGAPARPKGGSHRVSQKLYYWWTAAAVLGLGASGTGIGSWERFGSIAALPTLSALHRGLALIVLATLAWHVYGALVWEGRWWPEWSWLTGGLDEEKARRKVPGAHAAYLAQLAGLLEEGRELTQEERALERQQQEKLEVQAQLERGNALAVEERFVEALHHYRRALELYPGYSQALYNMARVLARMGEREMARSTYRQFLDADPFHPLARKAQAAIRELDEGGGGT